MAEEPAAPAGPGPGSGPGSGPGLAGSAALGLYLRLGAPAAAEPPPAAARPEGRLLWLHLTDPSHGAALAELIRRLRQERRRLNLLVTGAEPASLPLGTLLAAGPGSSVAEAAAFLHHWRPQAVALAGGGLLPAVVQVAAARGLPVALVDAGLPARRAGWRWWPGVARGMMQRIDHILAQDQAAARYFRRLGASAAQTEVVGRMEEALGALPCTEAEREVLSLALKARPVWLAVSLPEAEEAAVLAAHREVLGQRHRLLLILVPDQPARGPEIATRLSAEGWDVALRSRDEEPSEGDEVYIADTEGEDGLWYRLAPVTYMGGTLSGRGAPRHPYEAAALGSAILHGPKTLDFAPAYARLAKAEAVRLLRGAPQLATGLGELLAPDRAAQMAHNAWEVTSSGAGVTDRVVDYLLGLVDRPAPPAPAEGAPASPGGGAGRLARMRAAAPVPVPTTGLAAILASGIPALPPASAPESGPSATPGQAPMQMQARALPPRGPIPAGPAERP